MRTAAGCCQGLDLSGAGEVAVAADAACTRAGGDIESSEEADGRAGASGSVVLDVHRAPGRTVIQEDAGMAVIRGAKHADCPRWGDGGAAGSGIAPDATVDVVTPIDATCRVSYTQDSGMLLGEALRQAVYAVPPALGSPVYAIAVRA